MQKFLTLITLVLMFSCSGKTSRVDNAGKGSDSISNNRRIFSAESFWNQPIPTNAETDSQNEHYIDLLKKESTGARFGINLYRFTIPVFDVDSTTPTHKIGLHYLSKEEKENWAVSYDHFGHGAEFDAAPVPIPENALPDSAADAHLVLIDWHRRIVWDMWGAERDKEGNWTSNTGMRFDLDGPGIFNREKLGLIDGVSVHFFGPGRAAGVPVVAGLIFFDEVMQGEIKHKLAFATRVNAYRQYVSPAINTDGFTEDGIPEGAVIQLDPNLDLSKFDLLPGEIVVARALQKYGMVNVDIAGGNIIYAEQLAQHPGKSWNGILRDYEGGINTIPLEHFRVLKLENIVLKGDNHTHKHVPF